MNLSLQCGKIFKSYLNPYVQNQGLELKILKKKTSFSVSKESDLLLRSAWLEALSNDKEASKGRLIDEAVLVLQELTLTRLFMPRSTDKKVTLSVYISEATTELLNSLYREYTDQGVVSSRSELVNFALLNAYKH